ncbi:hypothetical protein KDA_33030 [Dictyobacter alpinus]|uniref:Uncharacterized protein n=1 Tax=Dictyobacter alpinus TaxID=2014873 RepID=A0A402B920_9CHLR|nr:hypothetical protein KDA_33030 [Dictyobacter alpinus]
MVRVLWAAAAAHRTRTTPDSGAVGARKRKIKKPCENWVACILRSSIFYPITIMDDDPVLDGTTCEAN